MELTVNVSKLENDHLIEIHYKEGDQTVNLQHLCSLASINDYLTEVKTAVAFAKSLASGQEIQLDSSKTSAHFNDSEPLAIEGFVPAKKIKSKAKSYSLDLPSLDEFDQDMLRQEVAFLSDALDVSVESSADLKKVCEVLLCEANTKLLPIYQAEIDYLNKLLGRDKVTFSNFSAQVSEMLHKLLALCSGLESDVLISDAESLAEKLGLQLPDDQLASDPFKYFVPLHNELVRTQKEIALSAGTVGRKSA